VSQKIDISIVSSGANLADARLHRLTRSLLHAGLSIEIFAPGLIKDAPQILNPKQQLTIRKPWFATAWKSTGLLARYYRSRTFVLRSRGQVLYAISPESIAPAFGYAKLLRKKFAVDLFEDYLQLLKDRAWASKFFGTIGWIAKSDTKSALWFARRADLTTVADIQVPPFDARNRLVVRNLPDRSMLTMSGVRNAIPRAIYIGDLRESRGLRAMLQVAEYAQNWEFDFIGGIAPVDQFFVDQWLQAQSARGKAAEAYSSETNSSGRYSSTKSRVRFHGKLAPIDSWKFAEGAWVGLSLLESTPAFIEAVPSKLYEYMSVGLASISSPLPRCIEIINQSKSGMVASNPSEVAAQLKYWEDNPMELDLVRSQAAQWAREHLDSDREYATFAAEMVKLAR